MAGRKLEKSGSAHTIVHTVRGDVFAVTAKLEREEARWVKFLKERPIM